MFLTALTLFDMGLLNRRSWGRGHEAPHHNFVAIALMIMKFGTGIKRDVFYALGLIGDNLFYHN